MSVKLVVMPNKLLKYIQLDPGNDLPDISDLRPFKAIVVIEDEVPQIWQWEVSRWLVQSGCSYMMAWGKECGSWEESVDEANQEAFNYEDVPPEQVVMTTCHEDEELSEVFWFAKHRAFHPSNDLGNTVILHISGEAKKDDLQSLYEQA